MKRWLFLPIDDRPITRRFPAMIAPLGEIELVSPPQELLGFFLTPGDGPALAHWLRRNAPGCHGAILNLDMLLYGGLIGSRTPAVSTEEALGRLSVLKELKILGLRFYVASVVMRLGITGSSPEAVSHHQLIHRWSQAVADPVRAAEAQELERQIPPSVLSAYTAARERNHMINQEAVRLTAAGIIDFLLLLQEDCSPQGIHRIEQEALDRLVRLTGAEDRVRLLPGTDEGSLLLLSRAALLMREIPGIKPVYSHEATALIAAPYEDRPLRETAALQIEAAGARAGDEGISLFINTPVKRYGDAHDITGCGPVGEESRLVEVTDGSPALLQQIREALEAGCPAAVADVAFANGADPLLTERLLREVPWTRLYGYAAWNTAGNTLGTAVAMTVLRYIDGGRQERLHQEALVTRILDDYYYQTWVRTRLNSWLQEQGFSSLNLGDGHPIASARAGEELQGPAAEVWRLGPGTMGYSLGRFSARLPWPRTFEVEIELELRH